MVVGELTVRVLGPVQLVGPGGEVVDVPSASQRRLLGALALHAPSPVRAEWLCGVLDVTPGALRTSVARLRRVVGDGLLHTSVTGYRLDAPVDATLVCAEIQSAHGDATALARALSRWVGRALDEFADEAWAVGDAVRLAAVRAAAVEDLAEALIAGHRTDEAIALLEPHVIEHPYRDRPRGLTIRALAAAGRQTEALRAYQRYREFLAEMAGTEPSDELRRIEQRVAAGWDGIDRDEGDEPGVGGRDVAPVRQRSTPVLHEVLAAASARVGRKYEFGLLVGTADRARDRGVQTVLLSGESGIGKTTLIAAFAREHCASSGWNVFYGRCDEQVVVPFQPFQSVIGRIVDELPDDVLMAHTATCGGDLLRLVPRLQTRVSATPPLAGDEITVRHLLFEAVADVVRRAAAIAPLVLVLDDLHWAEPTALYLLRHLVRNLANSPVVFLAAFRDTGEAADGHLRTALADLARNDAVRVELEGLDTIELGDLVQSRVAAVAGHDVGALADRLRDDTAGNPLFAEHLLRHWVGAGQLHLDDRVVTLSAQAAVDVPSTLRDLVWHRVSVLGGDAGPVLTAAAVLGVQFNERVLAAMTDVEGRDIARLLDRAVAAGLLADQPSISGTVRFAHALVARSMEADLGSRARTKLHAQAFRAMLVSHATPSPELAPRLAHHADLGGLLDEAQRWASEAGDEALANLAPDEAAQWFRKALDHATALGRPDAERADLLVRLGEAGYRAGHPTALDTIRQGAELAEACGADATLVRAALATDRGSVRLGSFAAEQLAIVEAALRSDSRADLTTRARLIALLAQSLVHTDQTERRTAAALEALDLARSSADPTVLARVAPDVLYALWVPGAGSIRSALAEEAIALADETGDPHLTYVVHSAAYSSAVCTGDAERASRYINRLRAVAAEIGEPRMQWSVGVLDGFEATMMGRFAEAERIINSTVELGMRIGESDAFSIFAAQSFVLGTFAGRHAELLPIVQQVVETHESVELPFRIAHAIVCCEVGRQEVASSLLHEAMARGLDAIPADLMRSTTLLGYAILAIELDDVSAAERLYPEIASLAGEVSFNGVTSQGPISAYAGKLASLLGRHGDAENFLLDALALTESFGWEYHRATTLIALARNRQRADGALGDEGERWLATAEQLCASHGIDSWAKRAVALRAHVVRGTALPSRPETPATRR
ncbi:MAG: AAA family ATPase [Acidimicrobiia bacterium]